MSLGILLAMVAFALTMSISPGPVNMVIVATSAHHGVRGSFPLISGATLGFVLLLAMLSLGFHRFISHNPQLLLYLGIAGCLFIVYLGYVIAVSEPDLSVTESRCPGFFSGALMQWLNPKAWMACMAGISTFSGSGEDRALLILVGLYLPVCYCSQLIWALLGQRIGEQLSDLARVKTFNRLMGGLLMLTACFLLYTQLR